MSRDLSVNEMLDEAGDRTLIRPASPFDLALLSGLHAACFMEAWDEAAMGNLLAMPGAQALLALAGPRHEPAGFALLRAIAGEGEIISIGVLPAERRAGIGRRLLQAATAAAAGGGAARLFLEVASDNEAARALYAGEGFTEVGQRRDYYRRRRGRMTALVMAKSIAPVDRKDS